MNRVTLTIHLDLPDGVTPDVSYGAAPTPPTHPLRPGYTPPPDPEQPPLPDAPPPDLFQEAARIFPESEISAAPVCAVHGNTMKRWPAGVSKKTNKPFNASWRCSVQDCTVKPIWDRDAA